MHTIGIDLGAGTAQVGGVVDGEPETVTLGGEREMELAVTFAPSDGEVIVGNSAAEYVETDPGLTVRPLTDADEALRVAVGGRTFEPPTFLALLFEQLLAHAEDSLGGAIERAVVAVPATCQYHRRERIVRAFRQFDAELQAIVSRPAAIGRVRARSADENGRMLICDFGRQRLETSLVAVRPSGEGPLSEVLTADASDELGSERFLESLVNWLAAEFEADAGVDVSDDSSAIYRLRSKATAAVDSFFEGSSTERIRAAHLTSDQHLSVDLTRDLLAALTHKLRAGVVSRCLLALDGAETTTDELDAIRLQGAPASLVAVRETLADRLGQTPTAGSDEVPAIGAALVAADLDRSQTRTADGPGSVLDVAPSSLTAVGPDGSVEPIVERGAPLPTREWCECVPGARETVRLLRDGERYGDLRGEHDAPLRGVEVVIDASGIVRLRPRTDGDEIADAIEITGLLDIPAVEPGELPDVR